MSMMLSRLVRCGFLVFAAPLIAGPLEPIHAPSFFVVPKEQCVLSWNASSLEIDEELSYRICDFWQQTVQSGSVAVSIKSCVKPRWRQVASQGP